MSMMSYGGDFMFSIFPVIFGVFFIIFAAMLIFSLVGGVKQWSKNNASPVLKVDARISSKRGDVRRHHHAGNDNMAMNTTTSTTYYVTFEVESGDRFELSVSGSDYGMMAEGDRGKLTFQGTRFISFERYK